MHELQPRPATAAEQEAFLEQGFFVVRSAFDSGFMRRVSDAFERLLTAADGLAETGLHRGAQFVIERRTGWRQVPTVHRVVWAGACEQALLEIGADPRILMLVASLLGSREMDHLINQAHFKMPGDGVMFGWHQDSVHRRFGTDVWRDVNGRGSYVQAVLAIDPMHSGNGPLTIVPGSHRDGHIHPPDRKVLDSGAFERARAITLALDAGDLALFGPYTVHRSNCNESRHPRRALINGYAYPGANSRVYPGEGSGRRLMAPAPTAAP